jgi:predicted PhzF superfamily epimerase YddE/YHI9
MPIPIFQVDAFTSEPFRGNPAAVCLLDGVRDDAWMQNVAMEMNLSETAFLIPRSPNRYDLRWMTPEVEVALCGHATLASAHVLFQTGHADSRRADALNKRILYVGRNSFDYLVEVTGEHNIRKLRPNMNLLRKIEARGIVVTAKADEGKDYDFISRAFYPLAGILEDPVTGSAHTMLGPYWAPKLGRTALTGFQASKRGGYVRLEVEHDRVRLFGHAKTIFKGELLV